MKCSEPGEYIFQASAKAVEEGRTQNGSTATMGEWNREAMELELKNNKQKQKRRYFLQSTFSSFYKGKNNRKQLK